MDCDVARALTPITISDPLVAYRHLHSPEASHVVPLTADPPRPGPWPHGGPLELVVPAHGPRAAVDRAAHPGGRGAGPRHRPGVLHRVARRPGKPAGQQLYVLPPRRTPVDRPVHLRPVHHPRGGADQRLARDPRPQRRGRGHRRHPTRPLDPWGSHRAVGAAGVATGKGVNIPTPFPPCSIYITDYMY